MVTTLFSDEIVNASELRAKQKHWLAKAYERPITVTNGSHKLTIFNRDKIGKLFLQNHFLSLAVKYCADNKAIAWTGYLTEKERDEFRNEFLGAIKMALVNDRWHEVDVLLDDWKATAETKQNKEVMKNLTKKRHKEAYILLKEE
jgi:hypothetical protein